MFYEFLKNLVHFGNSNRVGGSGGTSGVELFIISSIFSYS